MLPTLRYHPDPIATGSVKAFRFVCLHCAESIYALDLA